MTTFRYNENGTTWLVERATIDDFGLTECTTTTNVKLKVEASFDSFAKAADYFDSYCSGAEDYDGPCSNQNHSEAAFYRIVERHEGEVF